MQINLSRQELFVYALLQSALTGKNGGNFTKLLDLCHGNGLLHRTFVCSRIKPQKFFGPLDSFFGYAVAPIGDIDQDGFNDFGVSAPHDKPSGKVHIFRGTWFDKGIVYSMFEEFYGV